MPRTSPVLFLLLAACTTGVGGGVVDERVDVSLPLAAPDAYAWSVRALSTDDADARAVDLDEDGDVLVAIYEQPYVETYLLVQADGTATRFEPVGLEHADSLRILRMNEQGLAIGSTEFIDGPDAYYETHLLDLQTGETVHLEGLEARDINASGSVLAGRWGVGPPVVWQAPDDVVELPFSAKALADDGSVVGSVDDGRLSQAARWSPDEGLVLLEGGGERASASVVAPSGWPIAGRGIVQPGLIGSVQWDEDGAFGVLPPLAVQRGVRLNGSGWLVGSGQMLVHEGVAYDLGELVGEDLVEVVAINGPGQILATRRRDERRQAVLLTPAAAP